MDHLGFPASAQTHILGTWNGETAKLSYRRHPEPALTYFTHSRPGVPTVISADQIIGLFPISPACPNEYYLSYAEVKLPEEIPKDQRDKQAPAYTFHRKCILGSPPEAFIQDFTPNGNSCWNTRRSLPENRHQEDSTPILHIIASIGSGCNHAEAVHENLVDPFLKFVGCEHAFHKTTSPSTIRELAESIFLPAARRGIQKNITLLSGDGGVVDLINGLLDPLLKDGQLALTRKLPEGFAPPNVALLPLGTGNALANSAGISTDNTLGVAATVRGAPKPLPIFSVLFEPAARVYSSESASASETRVTQTHGAVVFSWGLHATLVSDSDTPAYRKHGAERFQMAAKECLFPSDGSKPHSFRGDLVYLHQNLAGAENPIAPRPASRNQFNYLLATQCSNLESGFTISPSSRPLDGRLHVLQFGDGRTGEDVMELMMLAYAGGKHVSQPGVDYEAVKGLELQVWEEEERRRRFCVDGTIYVVEKGGKVRVMEQPGRSVVNLVCWQD